MKSFDFIIVGAVSAGCVPTHRLSENPANSVLLIEGGPRDNHPLIPIPRGYGRLLAMRDYTRYFSINKTGGHNLPETLVRGKDAGWNVFGQRHCLRAGSACRFR